MTPRWWGRFQFPLGATRRWRVAGLHLVVARRPWEWRIWWWRDASPEATVAVGEDVSADVVPARAECVRAAFGETADPLSLVPVLADRALVVTPDVPFHVLPGEEVLAFVSAPVWVRIAVGQPERRVTEVAVQRPPDTWFGPSTMEGELCYASRTRLRLDPDHLGLPLLRAVVPVRMGNFGDDPLVVERVRLPVGELPLRVDAEGQLWTPPAVLRRESGMLARVGVGTETPPVAGATELVGPPRAPAPERGLMIAFSALFGL